MNRRPRPLLNYRCARHAGYFFRDMNGVSKFGTPYSLPNKRSVLEHMDESFSVPLREWVQEAQEDCDVSGNAAAAEFVINPDLVQCPYDNGFRQYVRVWDELFVAHEVRH